MAVRLGYNKSLLKVGANLSEVIKVSNGLQVEDGMKKVIEGDGTRLHAEALTDSELCASVEEVACAYYVLLHFSVLSLPHSETKLLGLKTDTIPLHYMAALA